MKRYWLAASIVCGAAVARPLVASAVDCGDVVTGIAVRLDRDLSCPGGTALTVRDGGRLHLGRHIVSCTAGGVGIAVQGTAARVAGGTVMGCDVGVAVSGAGHFVHDLQARFNGIGFRADGGVEGVRLRGNGAEFNQTAGFRVVGHGNAITRNTASGNGDVAVEVRGDDNLVSRNRTNGNCLAPGCTAAAYVVRGSGNEVVRNLATGERMGILLTPEAFGTAVTRNRIRFGLTGGVTVERGAAGNVLRGNEVRSLGTDLLDANGNCVANEWAGNVFETRDPACLE